LLDVQHFFPWVSFVAGIGGSLHCVGMCGGLVTASCNERGDIFRYQFGRLLGYLILGGCAGFLGSFLDIKKINPSLSWIPAIFLGGLFIFWGLKNLIGKKAELPVPKFVSHFYGWLWRKLVRSNKTMSRSFFTGMISIFLPCGLLFGVALGTLALQNPLMAMLSMFFFWLGTVPSMVVAPEIIQRFIKPLRSKLPKTYALSLILIGLLTIGSRVAKLNHGAQNLNTTKEIHHRSCH